MGSMAILKDNLKKLSDNNEALQAALTVSHQQSQMMANMFNQQFQVMVSLFTRTVLVMEGERNDSYEKVLKDLKELLQKFQPPQKPAPVVAKASDAPVEGGPLTPPKTVPPSA
jgi:hypothetical protein